MGGNDLLLGEDGSDFLGGGWGNDTLDGGSGDDYVNDGTFQQEPPTTSKPGDDDKLFGSSGNDRLNGEIGRPRSARAPTDETSNRPLGTSSMHDRSKAPPGASAHSLS